ncbi:hypothetical protein H0H92_002517 [Tricholoma furcatifolium]|nr:hypothetical protein H0H92_002517 [Tricholoma furcatifolium]
MASYSRHPSSGIASANDSAHQYTTPPGKRLAMMSNIPVQMSQGDVSRSVHNLLLASKRLQEALKEWSVGMATETQVSDAYVQLGTDFNVTITAFAHHTIDLSDIYSVPGELRVPLEQCLVNEPSPEILELHMPQIRRALYKLFKGIQARKDAWLAARGRPSVYYQ